MIVNFLSNAVKFSPMGSQIVIQMTESDTRPGVPAGPRKVSEKEVRESRTPDSKDKKKKKSMWSRVRMSKSPERGDEGTHVLNNLQPRVLPFPSLPCLVLKHTSVLSISYLHTFIFISHMYTWTATVMFQILPPVTTDLSIDPDV